MFIKIRKIIIFSVMSLILIVGIATVNAYNTKFSYVLTSGLLSPWVYSDYAWKSSKNENPVFNCTYSEGSTSYFHFDVVNSNHQSRVVPFEGYCTFPTREFERNTTQQGFKYKLGIKRRGGTWDSWAKAHGQWNVDSY